MIRLFMIFNLKIRLINKIRLSYYNNSIEGYDNIGVMQNFKEELDQKRQLKEDEILEKTLNEMNNTLKVGVMFAVVLMLGMYFFSQFIMSFRGL